MKRKDRRDASRALAIKTQRGALVKRVLMCLTAICILAVAILWYRSVDSNAVAWTEDVLMPGGTTVMVRRKQYLSEFARLDNPFGKEALNYSLEFFWKPLGTNVLFVGEEGTFTVALMDDQAEPALLIWVSGRDVYHKKGCPNPPYEYLVHSGSRWLSRPLQAVPRGYIRANLTMNGIKEVMFANGRHLTTDDTGNQEGPDGHFPFTLDFTGVTTQAIGPGSCRNESKRNWLSAYKKGEGK